MPPRASYVSLKTRLQIFRGRPAKPATSAQRLASNVVYQLGSQSLLLALSFVFSPYVVHRLGVDLYGLLILAGITTNYFAIVELGLGQATVKFLADAYARRDWNGLRLILWTSVLTYFALSAIGALGLVALTPWLTRLLRVPRASMILTEQVLYICAAGLAVSMMGSIFSSVPRAFERFDIVSYLSVPAGVGQLAVNVLLLYFGYSIRSLVGGGVAIQTLVLVAYIGVARHLLHPLGRPVFCRRALRELLGFGGLVSVSQVVVPVLAHVEKFIIGRVLTLSAVAFYSVPYNLVWSLTYIPGSVSGVLFPAFSRLTVEGDHGRRSQLLVRGTKYVLAAILPVAVVLAIFSRKFLAAWMGPDFAARSTGVLQVLAFAVVVNSVSDPAYQALQAMGRPGIPAAFNILEVFIHVPLCFFLIGRYGVLGGAIAWAVRVSLNSLLLTAAFTRVTGISYRSFVSGALLRPAAAAAGLLPVVLAAAYWFPELNRVATILAMAAVGSVYWTGVFALSLDREDRRHLGPLAARWIHWPGLMPAAPPPVKIT
jgi:O-antigen/teichoic acid export membrane protein